MKFNQKIYALAFILSVIYVSGCAPRTIPTSTIGFIDSRNKVLIATQDSEFKNAVLSKVTGNLEKENIFIEITDLSNLSSKSPEQFKAIVILNSYKYFNFNKHVKKFLENINEQEQKKIVLIATAGSPKRMNKGEEVDAISSASEIMDADHISKEIINRVNKILSQKY